MVTLGHRTCMFRGFCRSGYIFVPGDHCWKSSELSFKSSWRYIYRCWGLHFSRYLDVSLLMSWSSQMPSYLSPWGKEIPSSPLPPFYTRRTINQLICQEHGANNTKVVDLIPIQVIQSWTQSSLGVLFNSECSVILILVCAEPNCQLVPCKEGVPGLLAEQCLSYHMFPELKTTVTDTKENQSCAIHSPELEYCSPCAKSLQTYPSPGLLFWPTLPERFGT